MNFHPDEQAEPLTDRLTIYQKRRGFRFGAEAVALAHFAGRHDCERGVDLGAGSGVIALVMSEQSGFSHMTALELQPDYADMARRSVETNGLAHRITVIQGDLRRVECFLPAGRFDFVTCNPPFYPVGSGRESPNPARRIAMTEQTATLYDVVYAARFLLTSEGRLYLVHLPRRRTEVIQVLGDAGLSVRRIQEVFARRGIPPAFVLFEAGRGMADCREEPPLYLNS